MSKENKLEVMTVETVDTPDGVIAIKAITRTENEEFIQGIKLHGNISRLKLFANMKNTFEEAWKDGKPYFIEVDRINKPENFPYDFYEHGAIYENRYPYPSAKSPSREDLIWALNTLKEDPSNKDALYTLSCDDENHLLLEVLAYYGNCLFNNKEADMKYVEKDLKFLTRNDISDQEI